MRPTDHNNRWRYLLQRVVEGLDTPMERTEFEAMRAERLAAVAKEKRP
jgi:hypothetical protein